MLPETYRRYSHDLDFLKTKMLTLFNKLKPYGITAPILNLQVASLSNGHHEWDAYLHFMNESRSKFRISKLSNLSEGKEYLLRLYEYALSLKTAIEYLEDRLIKLAKGDGPWLFSIFYDSKNIRLKTEKFLSDTIPTIKQQVEELERCFAEFSKKYVPASETKENHGFWDMFKGFGKS